MMMRPFTTSWMLVDETHDDQAEAQDADEDGADDRAQDVAAAAEEAGAADDDGGDHVELQTQAEDRVAGGAAGRQHEAGQGRRHAAEREGSDPDQVGVDAREACGDACCRRWRSARRPNSDMCSR